MYKQTELFCCFVVVVVLFCIKGISTKLLKIISTIMPLHHQLISDTNV